MKVTKISQQSYKDVKENEKTSYWTKFADEERTLFTPSKPQFTEGSDIPIESLEVKTSKNGNAYFVIPDKPKGKPPEGVPAHKEYKGRDEDATTARTAVMTAKDLYIFLHQLKPPMAVDWTEFNAIADRIHGLIVLLTVTREPKK
jgi:hypothetical protein